MAHAIFISLTHHDTAIAEALRDALRDLFGDFLQFYFSTSKELEGGIKSGEDWFQWIVERVEQCDFALILITPSSVNKPWILWEAGAVAGAALASKQGALRKVRPLVYQVPSDLIPSPIRDSKLQFRRGDQTGDVVTLCKEIYNDYQGELSPDRRFEVPQKLNAAITSYIERVKQHLLDAPALPTGAVIEEWRLRLDEVMQQNRASEVEHLHDWLEIAFGRGPQGKSQPLDMRIHTRLGDLYRKASKFDRAVEQLQLARQMAPRDIFVLRTLARVYLDSGERERAKEVIDRIEQLDARAMVHNAECAALAGRWYRSGGNLQKAEDIFAAALDANPDSYYLANVLAEVRLEAGRTDQARDAFRRAVAIIDGLRERNVWIFATAANASFFLGEDDRATAYVERIRQLEPSADDLASIERGLQNIGKHVAEGERRARTLGAALRG